MTWAKNMSTLGFPLFHPLAIIAAPNTSSDTTRPTDLEIAKSLRQGLSAIRVTIRRALDALRVPITPRHPLKTSLSLPLRP